MLCILHLAYLICQAQLKLNHIGKINEYNYTTTTMETLNTSPATITSPVASGAASATPVRCINPASDVNARLDTQVEVRVYPCNNSQGNGKKKFTTFNVKPEVSLTCNKGHYGILEFFLRPKR